MAPTICYYLAENGGNCKLCDEYFCFLIKNIISSTRYYICTEVLQFLIFADIRYFHQCPCLDESSAIPPIKAYLNWEIDGNILYMSMVEANQFPHWSCFGINLRIHTKFIEVEVCQGILAEPETFPSETLMCPVPCRMFNDQ